MKNIILSILLVITNLFVFAIDPHTDHVQVDTKSSIVKWKGSKVAEFHEGMINILNGELLIKHGVFVGGQFVLDMNSITNTDVESEKYRSKLENHLKSTDFFDVDQFPKSELMITQVIHTKGSEYTIIADLTIKGKTHPIEFLADVQIKESGFIAQAKIKIDRTKWDVVYNSGNFFKDLGDYLILDEIEFDVLLLSVE